MKKYYELEEDVIKELERNRQRKKRSICQRLFSETIYTASQLSFCYFWLFYPLDAGSQSEEIQS